MSFAALNIASTSLRAQQKAIDVVSHNMANVNTAGYSRQTPQMATASPVNIGNLSFGRGINLNNIQRVVDPMISSAQRENASQFEYWTAVTTGLTTIESTFGSLDNTGLAASVDDYFLAWQQLSNNPQDIAQKNNVLNKSESLTTQLNNMHSQLYNAQQSLDKDVDQQIAAVNLKIDEISALSNQIKATEAAQNGTSSSANDIRDQRDEAIRQLAKIIPIQQVTTGDGSILIQTMGGDMLTHDGIGRHLVRSNIADTSGYLGVAVEGTNNNIQGLETGGALGGLMALRDGHFQNYIDTLDSFSANLAYSTNQVHSSAGGGTRSSVVQSGQGAFGALNAPTQSSPFASKVQAGTFSIHVYDAAGIPTAPTSDYPITIDPTGTMADVAASINTALGAGSASVDGPTGQLIINAGANTVAFSNDTSNFLAAYEVNSFFHGSTSGGLSVSQAIKTTPATINTGTITPITSIVYTGDNSAAIQIMNLQDQAISTDGSVASSLHNRISGLSAQYGLDVGIANQQTSYRESEASSLTQQREAISGVNVDEELISMMKFQRAYEASAKVISTSNQMMDSLMGIL
ncbi:MAG: flagellar hook-associated protein FlgK [Ghiorsea sp.]